jgi:hypothetical protein
MDIPTIIEQLAEAEGLPEGAIHAARERRAAAAPAFVDLVERYLAADADAAEVAGALFWVFHLLGEWREKSAYRPLARLLAMDAEELDEILGDAITSTSQRVMAAVFDGDPAPLYEVIEAENADPFVRSCMLETLAMLVLRSELDRAEVARYLRDAFSHLRPHEATFVWYGWQSAIAALRLEELTSLVERAFERGLIDPMEMKFAEHRCALEHALAHPEAPWWLAAPKKFAPFEDTITELGSWYAFSPKDLERDATEDIWEPDFEVSEPAINPFKGVGRDDPCPCGSGKKFKRCCLA